MRKRLISLLAGIALAVTPILSSRGEAAQSFPSIIRDAEIETTIRDYTTPEMFAELSMIIRERGDAPQKTEVVSVEAQLVEAVVEGDWENASVRFYGLIREDNAANPEPFDEIWHVRKKAGERKASWLIAGIQQNG